MPARPRTTFVVAALAAAPLLAACQKPTPLVTIFANGQTYHEPATAFVTDGRTRTFNTGQPVIDVTPGNRVGIDVDRTIAHGTWVATIDGTNAAGQTVQEPITMSHDTHYASFLMPDQNAAGQALPLGAVYTLRVTVTTGETGRNDDRVGQWIFRLRVAA